MRTAIFKQEWKESWRNKRLVWVPVALMLLAAMQPLTLYFLPDILASGGNLPDGTVIEIPTPTPAEVLLSVSEQLRQIGLLVVLLSAMHTFSQERTLGTLAWLKSLNIPASRIVMSKWAHYTLLSAVSILLAQGTAAYYTVILFDSFDVTDFLISTGLLIVHFVVQLSIFFLFAALLESGLVALVITLGVHFVLSLLLSWIDWDWLPWNLGGLSGQALIEDISVTWPLVTSIVLIGLALVIASKRLLFLSSSS
ncbi:MULTISPECIES: ABC transporter permease [unclassified Exiguobacterium]|uniref:ABC transporter permease n=1 Tax=unclassified Exiguobacterium TaxID=2644629 RepID=UPI00103A84C7|nr:MULTISPECIES: ABC transporter permease subunit [unclassified Exiguobacterium]TCI48142.1 hypothetical protein EVJ31_03640 [Exiguobacterium sp. SH5S32]TCI55027.1 hypothetical protein EVJ25_03635 [Exiguobacterium sp. SH1S4]TCI74821.1 hypothetical protein EVJ23_03630 [Exiguobacterium sp. SH1S1]